MTELSQSDIEDLREVFDLFDFWDGRDGLVDGIKIGDFLRCSGVNPTISLVKKVVGAPKDEEECAKFFGEKQYKFEELLPIYEAVNKETDTGTFADFMECFKTFDREGQGFISSAEVRMVLGSLGERLTEVEIDQIFEWTETREDLEGNIKYEDFIKKVMAGPRK